MGLVAAGQGFYSWLHKVRVVKAVKKQNLIQLSDGFVRRNGIHASPGSSILFGECIIIRSPKGKMYE